jgi:hypothetical protein
MELKLPVPVKALAAVTDALCKIHGKKSLFMRQVGQVLQIYKPAETSPPKHFFYQVNIAVITKSPEKTVLRVKKG